MAHSVRQVYYVPYPLIQPRRRERCVVIKFKPMSHIGTNDPMEGIAYQDNEISPINEVIKIEEITNWCDIVVKGQQVDITALLPKNIMDEKHEELESEDNNRSNEDDQDFKDTHIEIRCFVILLFNVYYIIFCSKHNT